MKRSGKCGSLFLCRQANFDWDDSYAQYHLEIMDITSNTSGLSFKLPPAEQLHRRAGSMPDESSTGPDGRAPIEVERLPLWIWELVSTFWGCIFKKGGEWREPLLKAHVAFIPKSNEGPPSPSNLRPITILSANCRAFSACMFHNLLEWHDSWRPPNLVWGKASC